MRSTTTPKRRTAADHTTERVIVSPPPPAQVPWEPRILAGDPDDDGSEPHICRGID